MPESESFDAFYARTVWSVTSQMHALAGEDSLADHAIREAYAKAYQQWYEVASYPDTEGWVLAVATDAYQRRRPAAGASIGTPARTGHDPLSWPGMFRPRPGTGEADPAASVGSPLPGSLNGLWAGADGGWAMGVASEPAESTAGLMSGPPGSALATARIAADPQDLPGPPRDPVRPGRSPQQPGFRSRRPLIAMVAVVAVVVAGAAVYLTASGHPAHSARRATAGGTGQPAVRMLAAGRTGSRTSIPWSLLGPGWTLAEVSAAPAGTAAGTGTVTTYLVDPEGGRYQIRTSAGPTPRLLAWSGDAQNALYAVPASAGAGVTYDLLAVKTGNVTVLPLPANVTAVGFSRPDGLAVLAVRQTSGGFRLQRFTLDGRFQATIGTLPRKQNTPDWLPGCGTGCGALSSPDGTRDVWGVSGDQMQLVGNAGGLIKRLDVPGSGSPPSCVPLAWWNATTVLSYCAVTGQQYPVGRLWLVPTDGSTPTALTGVSGSAEGSGVVTGAWQGPGSVYVTATDGQQCSGAASGPGGLALLRLTASSLQPVTVDGATGNHTSVVSVSGGRLLVLAQTSCPGTSALLWLNPSTGATTTVLAAPANQAGVLFAVPYGGLGQTATSAG